MSVSYLDVIEKTVSGLGFCLIEVQRSAGGLLRVTLEHPYVGGQPERLIQVEDCERVTRQLQYVLEVEGVDYSRLEVSSPGIDRLLKDEQDLARFVGSVVDITLKQPLGQAGQVVGQGISANRRKFRGMLERADAAWQITWRDEIKPIKPGARVSQKKLDARPLNVLGFEWIELREIRLAPIVDFKGLAHNGS